MRVLQGDAVQHHGCLAVVRELFEAERQRLTHMIRSADFRVRRVAAAAERSVGHRTAVPVAPGSGPTAVVLQP